MTLSKKLFLCFASAAGLLLISVAASLVAIGNLSGRFSTTAGQTVPKLILADRINNSQSDMLAWQGGMIMFTFSKDAAKADMARQRLREAVSASGKAIDDLRPLVAGEEARRLIDNASQLHQEWITEIAQMERLCASGDADSATKVAANKTLQLYETINRDALRLAELAQEKLGSDGKAADEERTRSKWIAFLIASFGLAAGVVVFFVLRQTSDGLRRIASSIGEGATQVAGAAVQVSNSSQGLAQGASEQAATLQETSASGGEISSMVRKNAENSHSAAQLMDDAARAVQEANRKLDQMVTSMKDINASSEKISKIIKVIDEIAFQTNILALNAAVEAARAGEAGMGFAVVADEVRNLAQRSAQAAKDTAGLIEESISKSTEGAARLDEVASAIHSITEAAGKVKTLVDEVSLGSQEQSRGIEQIAKAISQMEQVTQKTAANAEESASAGEELSSHSEHLREEVSELLAIVGGGDGAGAGGPASRAVTGRPAYRGTARPNTAALGALRKAVGGKPPASAHVPVPASDMVAAGVTSFPLDQEEFKEF